MDSLTTARQNIRRCIDQLEAIDKELAALEEFEFRPKLTPEEIQQSVERHEDMVDTFRQAQRLSRVAS